MTDRPNHRIAATTPQLSRDAADTDAFLLDDEFDDLLDRNIAAIRESLADFRDFQ